MEGSVMEVFRVLGFERGKVKKKGEWVKEDDGGCTSEERAARCGKLGREYKYSPQRARGEQQEIKKIQN
ncbi:uncharacterized protein G2W53_041037 [Senna tora]|uniref:Uncharacterized protein n=1 Tax=Senna tora TaxID=362788 RepID=A0A834SF36_9FABA|nr:uncharacterized protein G2W53_041037 [Senna tora]